MKLVKNIRMVRLFIFRVQQIDEARQEYKNGETLHFQSAADAQQWMESL